MNKFYAVNDWGLVVDEIPENYTEEQFKDAGFVRINPVPDANNSIYYDASGEWTTPRAPFWFLPIEQPGLYEAPYNDSDDIQHELWSVFPAFAEEFDCEPLLAKVNVVGGEQ